MYSRNFDTVNERSLQKINLWPKPKLISIFQTLAGENIYNLFRQSYKNKSNILMWFCYQFMHPREFWVNRLHLYWLMLKSNKSRWSSICTISFCSFSCKIVGNYCHQLKGGKTRLAYAWFWFILCILQDCLTTVRSLMTYLNKVAMLQHMCPIPASIIRTFSQLLFNIFLSYCQSISSYLSNLFPLFIMVSHCHLRPIILFWIFTSLSKAHQIPPALAATNSSIAFALEVKQVWWRCGSSEPKIFYMKL